MLVRSLSRGQMLALAIGAAGLAGVIVGALTAPSPPPPEPTIAVAQVPTSTPDLRRPLPTPAQTTTPPLAVVPNTTASPSSSSAPAPSPTPLPPTAQPPSPTARPSPTAVATPTPQPLGRAVVYFASDGKPPAAVWSIDAIGGRSDSDRVFFRLNALRITKTGGPDGFVNLVGTMNARLLEVTVETRGTVVVGYSAPNDEWGVTPEQVRLVLQQIVFTATEEPSIERVQLTQNGGRPAVIAGQPIDKPLGRADLP